MKTSKIPTMLRNVQGWYGKSVVRTVRKIHGTKRPRYKKSTSGTTRLWYE